MKSIEIIKRSNEMTLLKANDLFDPSGIDRTMTHEKFIKERKISNISIEDFILKERNK